MTMTRLPRIRLTPREHAHIAAIEDELARRAQRANEAAESNRVRIHYFVALKICCRWEAAGYTSATLLDGLPRPEKGHPAAWDGEGMVRYCRTCGRSSMARKTGDTCSGPSALGLVLDALAAGVPFGLVDGLPVAGVRPEPGDVVVKLARATCRPARRLEAA
jgi:hypothetical protein